ncbi:TonB-dependent siderophore receptor [Methylomonas rivi]|uniref:TonB-dependent siderophore receptor n=1 Tax=Methylomonas rivi TaxID=2952226 RepID=A0ABT1U9C5_9GAMM|nr:TonB-dependent siderophore receptor [Methylomonas sp. WSC-6]MCQ8130420.1 TonB-dependent siderophore receptor [Methylomonas sp. WSC-6]
MTLAIKGLAVAITLISAQAHAEDGKHRFDIPAQALAGALQTLAAQSGAAMLYTEQTAAGKTSPALQGEYTLDEAVRKLLSGSGLIYSIDGSGTVTLKPAPGGRNATTLEPLTVKGVRNPNDPYDMDYAVTNATTATKTDTPLMETPVSIQVIPKGVLADKQSMTLPEAVNGHVSGVLGRTGGGYLYDNFVIRGLAGSGFGDAYRNGLFNRQDIYDIANIERIEILKGPAAVLYGRIEPGGLVNYVTKKPLDTPYYSLQQQFGSYDQYRTLVDATGPIDDDKTLLYRLNGSYTDNGSFRDFVGNQRFFVAPSLAWRPNDRFESNLELEYKHDRLNADFGIPAVNGRPAPIPITRTLKDGPQRQLMESTLVGADWTYHFNNNWKLTQRYLFKDWSLSGPTLYNYLGLQNDQRSLNRIATTGVQDVMTHSGNIDLNGKFELLGSQHNLLIGVDGFHATTESHDADNPAPAIDIYNPIYGQVDFAALTNENAFFYRKESWVGAYVQDQITLFDKLHILLGGRYDNVTTGANFTPTSLAAAKAGRVEQKDDAFSPRAGVLYQVQDWLSVYGSYTESFSSNNGVSASGASFDPQEGQQHEVGIKTESNDKRFSSTLAYFHLTKSNLLTDDPNQADPNFQILAGKIRSKGIELDLAGQVTDQLHLLATYAYTQVNYIEEFSGLRGNRLENVPRHQGSLWGTWQFDQAFKAGLGVVAVGRRPGDSDNTFILPGYARLDAMAAYTHRIGQHRLTAQLNINNLLDKEYYANTDGGSLSAIPGTPFSVLGSLKYEF